MEFKYFVIKFPQYVKKRHMVLQKSECPSCSHFQGGGIKLFYPNQKSKLSMRYFHLGGEDKPYKSNSHKRERYRGI